MKPFSEFSESELERMVDFRLSWSRRVVYLSPLWEYNLGLAALLARELTAIRSLTSSPGGA